MFTDPTLKLPSELYVTLWRYALKRWKEREGTGAFLSSSISVVFVIEIVSTSLLAVAERLGISGSVSQWVIYTFVCSLPYSHPHHPRLSRCLCWRRLGRDPQQQKRFEGGCLLRDWKSRTLILRYRSMNRRQPIALWHRGSKDLQRWWKECLECNCNA